jgi:hypothetical protein
MPMQPTIQKNGIDLPRHSTCKRKENKKTTPDSKVVPHRNANLARQCFTLAADKGSAVTVVWLFLTTPCVH